MTVLGVLLVVIACPVVALLVLPFELDARGRVTDETARGRLRVRWGLGLLSLSADPQSLKLRVLGVPVWKAPWHRMRGAARRKKPRSVTRSRKASSEKPPREDVGGNGVWAAYYWRRLWRMGSRLFETLHFRVCLRGTVGVGDPAAMAWVFPLVTQLKRLPGFHVGIRCDWTEEVIDVSGRLAARLWLVETTAVALYLAVQPENWRAVRTLT